MVWRTQTWSYLNVFRSFLLVSFLVTKSGLERSLVHTLYDYRCSSSFLLGTKKIVRPRHVVRRSTDATSVLVLGTNYMTYYYYIFLVRLVNVDPDISRRSPVRSRVKTPCYVLRMCPFYGRQRINPGVRLHDYLHTAGAPLQVMLCQLRIMHLDVTDALSQGYNLKWVSTITITITYYHTLLGNFRPALPNRMVTVVFVLN